jgi:hypothetical protein
MLILSTALLLFDASVNTTMADFTKLVQSLAEQGQPVSLSRTLREVRARYIWLASVVLNITVPVGAAVLCGLITYAPIRGDAWWWWLPWGPCSVSAGCSSCSRVSPRKGRSTDQCSRSPI